MWKAAARLTVATAIALASMSIARSEAIFTAMDAGTVAPIRIDGELEELWNSAPVFDDFIEYRPRKGVQATVRTEVRFARDAHALYVAARMFDSDISKLRSGYARRDGYSNEQDWFQVIIDPLGTKRVAHAIYVNPHGVVWDGLLNDDSGTFNTSADFDVETATRVQADSWVAEIRIPFTELRYASRTADNWNILVRRSTPRGERHAMAIPEIPAGSCFVCFSGPITGLGNLPAARTLELIGQVVGLSHGVGEHANALRWESSLEPGLEIKYRASAATVLDATINPDFSQVELDRPQLSSNEQFAVSFEEKRPFFLEGIDILDDPLQAIYTRSITDPAWGVRATHRGGWDGVFLTTRDEGGGLVVLPGAIDTEFARQDFASHATIARGRMPVRDFTFGALMTDRRSGGGYNTVAGPDVAWLISPNARLRFQWLMSRTQGSEDFPGIGQPAVAEGSAVNVDWQHETLHWRTELILQQLDDEFRADNGFIPQVGIRKLEGELRYKFTDLPVVSELAPYVSMDVREALNGELVNEAPRAGIEASLPRNSVVTLEWRPQERARVRPGSELRSAKQVFVALTSSPTAGIPSLSVEGTFGEAIDFGTDRAGSGQTLGASILLRPWSRLEIEPRAEYTTIRTDGTALQSAQTVSESAAQLLATLHLNTRNRFRLIAQHIDVERKDTHTAARLQDQSRLVGSLLFTHERSLASRLYIGVSYLRVTGSTAVPTADELEFFVKLQAGFSPGEGLR